MLAQIVNPLESLKNAILQVIVQVEYEIYIPIETVMSLWERSEFNKIYSRRLTDSECVYIAQQIRIYFEMDRSLDDKIYHQIKSIIGEQANSIFSIIKVALIGVFAYMAYRIVKK